MVREDSGYGYTVARTVEDWLLLRLGKHLSYDEARDLANDIESAMADGDWLAFRDGTTFTRTFTPGGKK